MRFDNQAFRIFVVAGLIVEMLFMLLSCVMGWYKAYWLTDFLLIKNWARFKKNYFLLKQYALLLKKKETNKYKKKASNI